MLIIFLIGGYFVLRKTGDIFSKAAEGDTSLKLKPDAGTFNLNEVFDVDIKVDTAGTPIYGVQIISLHFDYTKLEVVDADPDTDGIQITKGNISAFNTVMQNEAFNVGDKAGTIRYSESKMPGRATFNGSDTIVAKIRFKAIDLASATDVTFDFDPTSVAKTMLSDYTGDTNLLKVVGPATYQIIPPAPTVSLTANGSDGSISIDSGNVATLSWSSTLADTCTASDGWFGEKPITGGSEPTGALTAPTTYILTCVGAGGTILDSVTVNINSLPPKPPDGGGGDTSGGGGGDTGGGDTGGGDTSGDNTDNTYDTGSNDTSNTPSLLTPADPIELSELPPNIEPPTAPPLLEDNTVELYQNDSMQPWTLWFLYAIIPAFLAGGAIYFYLKRKHSKNNDQII